VFFFFFFDGICSILVFILFLIYSFFGFILFFILSHNNNTAKKPEDQADHLHTIRTSSPKANLHDGLYNSFWLLDALSWSGFANAQGPGDKNHSYHHHCDRELGD